MSAPGRRLSDLGELLRRLPPGASVVLHSGCAEPGFLAAELARCAPTLDGLRVYAMMPMGRSPYAAPELQGRLVVRTFFPGKGLREAVTAGRAELIRVPLSAIPPLFGDGGLTIDLVLLQVSPPDENGRCSLGVSVDYMPAVLAQDPIVVAEINPAMPRTCGASHLAAADIDYFVEASGDPQPVPPAAADAVDHRIAEHVAGLIGHGAVLQSGIGSLPDLVLGQLTHLRDLGIHTGIVTDAVRPLIEQGVVTNATKRAFRGISITSMAAGTQAFYDFLHRNPAIEFHPCTVTHDAATLAGIDGLCSINSVLQVDLTGRANAERVDGRVISSMGGLPDFARGASAAKGGMSIIALRSTAKGGRQGNLLAELAPGTPVTVGAAHVDFVVTEHGVARLRGLGAADRARALIAVAHPDHRDALRGAA